MRHDVWFVSYQEPNAEENWRRAASLVPRAQRLHGIEGLVNAYKTAARRSRTDWFFVIDGDNWLLDASVFDFTPEEPADGGQLFVWPSRNSINGLEYGNGAVKLYNRAAALEVPDGVEDFSIAVCTTRIKFRQVAAETRIHASPIQAWTAGFREGFKLRRRMREGEGNALRQFEVWTTRGAEVPNGRYAIAGAWCGCRQFDRDPGFAINDHARLRALFEAWRQACVISETSR